MDDSTGATIANFAGLVPVEGSYTAMALQFAGYDVPLLYWSGGLPSATQLVPYANYVYFRDPNCTGDAARRAYQMDEQGFGVFGYVADYNGVTRVLEPTGVLETGATYESWMDGVTCVNQDESSDFFQLEDVVGGQLPPLAVPFGFSVRAS